MRVQHLITVLIIYKHYAKEKKNKLKIELITTENTNFKKTPQTVPGHPH